MQCCFTFTYKWYKKGNDADNMQEFAQKFTQVFLSKLTNFYISELLTWQYIGLLKRRTSSIVSFVNSRSLGIERSVIGFSFSSIPVASPCSAYK